MLNITPEALKAILLNAEKLSDKFPYEYICWKNLLADIEIPKESIEEILAQKLNKQNISEKDLEQISSLDFMDKWFLDPNYSDEFEDVINQRTTDFNKLIEENVDKVFYKDEESIWSKRLLMSAYLELSQGKAQTAELLYNLYFDKKHLREFFKNILRKSIYEYYISLKFDTELNNGRYSIKELDEIIKKIEGLWVCTK